MESPGFSSWAPGGWTTWPAGETVNRHLSARGSLLAHASPGALHPACHLGGNRPPLVYPSGLWLLLIPPRGRGLWGPGTHAWFLDSGVNREPGVRNKGQVMLDFFVRQTQRAAPGPQWRTGARSRLRELRSAAPRGESTSRVMAMVLQLPPGSATLLHTKSPGSSL